MAFNNTKMPLKCELAMSDAVRRTNIETLNLA